MNNPRMRARARRLIAIGTLAAVAAPALAELTGKGEAGLAIASGNADTKTANAKISIGWKTGNWENTFGLAGLYVRNDGLTTARRWEASEQTHYNFSGDGTFWFGGVRYEEDHFSGFDHQGVVDTGAGHKFINTDTTKLSGQVGVGYKFWETFGTPREKESSLAGTAGVDFLHKLTATTTLTNKFGTEITSGNKFMQNELGVAVKVSDRLALAVAYAVRHNTDPPAGFRKTDTLTTMNLVYEVK
jgi:putative salt-induced outer membrane protein